jgi:phage baseplate assembly protein W
MAPTTGLGRSLELRDGDLALDDGRLAEVSGLDNLVQALTLRVLTPLGSDRFTTTYGLDVAAVFTQATGTRTAQDLLRLSLVRALGTDPRVRELRDVTVLDPPDAGRRLWPVLITLVAVDGTAHTVGLDVVI